MSDLQVKQALQALQGLQDPLEQQVLKVLQEILVRQDLLVQQAQ
jgi:hypothetical protein